MKRYDVMAAVEIAEQLRNRKSLIGPILLRLRMPIGFSSEWLIDRNNTATTKTITAAMPQNERREVTAVGGVVCCFFTLIRQHAIAMLFVPARRGLSQIASYSD
jgi:hypothetical protein